MMGTIVFAGGMLFLAATLFVLFELSNIIFVDDLPPDVGRAQVITVGVAMVAIFALAGAGLIYFGYSIFM